MGWRVAAVADAALLADLAAETSDTKISSDEASAFLQNWHVEIDAAGGVAEAAVAVLPPALGRHRGYGAWWTRHGPESARFSEITSHLVQVAASTPDVRVLQVTLSTKQAAQAEQLRALQFEPAYPVWTMVHDNSTWPQQQPELPAPLRYVSWPDVLPGAFERAYEQAYRDQRLVEPHTAESWEVPAGSNSFATELAALAVSTDGRVVGFVLGFGADGGGVELGPIGTIPSWRGKGVSSALLASVLIHCRDTQQRPITLTVDGASPTGAQRLYLRHGFQVTEHLVAYQVRLPG
jgi:GNAT superfamily N-acetyltransferase